MAGTPLPRYVVLAVIDLERHNVEAEMYVNVMGLAKVDDLWRINVVPTYNEIRQMCRQGLRVGGLQDLFQKLEGCLWKQYEVYLTTLRPLPNVLDSPACY